MPSSDFIAKTVLKNVAPTFTFHHNSIDCTSLLIGIDPIYRDASLNAGACTVRLRNNTGYWDDFYDDHTALYKSAIVGLEFAGLAENVNLFKGYVESARLIGDHTCILTIRDRISRCLEKEIGGGETDVYYNLYVEDEYTVSEIVWDILTTYAGLDDTESSGNNDINYTHYENWATIVDADYELGCRFIGHTVRHALDRIMNMTNSIFWVNANGKIDFVNHRSYLTAPGPAIEEYTKAMIFNDTREYNVTLEGRINTITCKYDMQGRQARSHFRELVGETSDQIIYGPSDYDEELIEEDNTVWHETESSADNWMDAATGLLSRVGPPIRTFTFQTGLSGFIQDIGNGIILRDHFADPLDEIELAIINLILDPDRCVSTITGNWLWL